MKFNPADYDVTVTCGFPFTNRVLRNHKGTPHVFVTQNGDHMLSAPQIDYRSFDCDGLVCTNPVIYERHRNRWPSALIPNGVDVKEFSPNQTNRPAGEPPTALMVSALTPSKHVIEGIRAAAAVKNLKLVIAGKGEMVALVERTGRDLIPGRFHVHPHPPDEMPDVYREADVFLHMSQDEPSAIAYLEALATGLPIVAHDSPVTRWTFEETAHLVDTNDSAAVTAALRQAIETNSAEKIAARRELADRRFAWPMIGRRYLDFFRQVKQSC
jgi:glycosyltransferase involved in cell wall biosynthesis